MDQSTQSEIKNEQVLVALNQYLNLNNKEFQRPRQCLKSSKESYTGSPKQKDSCLGNKKRIQHLKLPKLNQFDIDSQPLMAQKSQPDSSHQPMNKSVYLLNNRLKELFTKRSVRSKEENLPQDLSNQAQRARSFITKNIASRFHSKDKTRYASNEFCQLQHQANTRNIRGASLNLTSQFHNKSILKPKTTLRNSKNIKCGQSINPPSILQSTEEQPPQRNQSHNQKHNRTRSDQVINQTQYFIQGASMKMRQIQPDRKSPCKLRSSNRYGGSHLREMVCTGTSTDQLEKPSLVARQTYPYTSINNSREDGKHGESFFQNERLRLFKTEISKAGESKQNAGPACDSHVIFSQAVMGEEAREYKEADFGAKVKAFQTANLEDSAATQHQSQKTDQIDNGQVSVDKRSIPRTVYQPIMSRDKKGIMQNYYNIYKSEIEQWGMYECQWSKFSAHHDTKDQRVPVPPSAQLMLVHLTLLVNPHHALQVEPPTKYLTQAYSVALKRIDIIRGQLPASEAESLLRDVKSVYYELVS